MKNCTTITVPAVTVITATRLPIRVRATCMENKHYSTVGNDRHYIIMYIHAFMILCVLYIMFVITDDVYSSCNSTIIVYFNSLQTMSH